MFVVSGIMLIAYIAIFALQIVLLVLSVRKKTMWFWMVLFLLEILSMIVAFVLMRYFDSLPGYGFMPGLSYFGEVISSFGAVILYVATLFVSLFVLLIQSTKKRK